MSLHLKAITTILFDLDGTLLDTAPDLAAALNQLLAAHNQPSLDYEHIRPLASSGSPGLLKLAFGIDTDDANYASLREKFIQLYHQSIDVNTQPFEGIIPLLKKIEHYNMQWGIVTNKPEWLAEILLEKFNMTSQCRCLIGQERAPKRKPAPDGILMACDLMNVTTTECIYIGDAQRDISAAKQANMLSVAALYGYINQQDDPKEWQADHYINHPKEFEAIIDKIHQSGNSKSKINA